MRGLVLLLRRDLRVRATAGREKEDALVGLRRVVLEPAAPGRRSRCSRTGRSELASPCPVKQTETLTIPFTAGGATAAEALNAWSLDPSIPTSATGAGRYGRTLNPEPSPPFPVPPLPHLTI